MVGSVSVVLLFVWFLCSYLHIINIFIVAGILTGWAVLS